MFFFKQRVTSINVLSVRVFCVKPIPFNRCLWLHLPTGVHNISQEGGQALAGNRRLLSLLQKVLGETLPALPSLVRSLKNDSMFGVFYVVDTAILVVLSARLCG